MLHDRCQRDIVRFKQCEMNVEPLGAKLNGDARRLPLSCRHIAVPERDRVETESLPRNVIA